MRKIITLVALLSAICASSGNILVKVIEQDSNDAVPFASLTIEYPDTIISAVTDIEGRFSLTPLTLPFILKANGFGLKESLVELSALPDSVLTISLEKGTTELQEISVIGRLTTQTDSGISYNMAADHRIGNENALQSLSYVPLVSVDPDGEISVQGTSLFSLYLNGHPNEIAQTSPKAFLESLPASSIAKVEVITRPDNKYGGDAQRYILNIILKQPLLNGYMVNLSAGGNSQPAANGSSMGMIKKNKVDAAIEYNYNLNGQRNQPNEIIYTEKNSNGDDSHMWSTAGKGDGDWHTHTIRAMLKWDIDSLNSLYADAHGQISQTDITEEIVQKQMFPISDATDINIRNRTEYSAGSAEANLIYRNYFKDRTGTERITAGYHYTYNPDLRHITQDRRAGDTQYPKFIQRTDGGLNTHSGLFSYLLQPSSYHSVRFTISDTYREGHSESKYSYHGNIEDYGSSMRYANNIAALNVAYAGWIGKVYCSASVKGNYDYFSMHLPQTPELNYKRNSIYVFPAILLYWRPDSYDALYLNYSTDIIRPGIDMLNPFESSLNDLSISRGNPDLKAQYNHKLTLSWYLTRIKNLTLAASIGYTHSEDVILTDYFVEKEKMIYTFSNFGLSDQTEVTLDLSYNPTDWVSLSVNGSIGKRWLHSDRPKLTQNDLNYNISPRIDFYLPKHYRLGAKFGQYKNLPGPWSAKSTISVYSFFASKSFFSGRLNISVQLNSPFNKYILNRTKTELHSMATEQKNYMTGRSFGINISYSFRGGQNVGVERDRSLESKDMDTGVK